MIEGDVTPDGVPRVRLPVAGQEWISVIDTGFNGDVELPYALGSHLNPRFRGTVDSQLADGSFVTEESYDVEIPFDGKVVEAVATFAVVDEILIGTRLLRRHRLEIDFPNATVFLARKG